MFKTRGEVMEKARKDFIHEKDNTGVEYMRLWWKIEELEHEGTDEVYMGKSFEDLLEQWSRFRFKRRIL